MSAPKEMLGTIRCLNRACGVEIPLKRSAGGAISANCPYCDITVYARAQTQAHRAMSAECKPLEVPAAKGAPGREPPPPAPKGKAEPAPAGRSTVFG